MFITLNLRKIGFSGHIDVAIFKQYYGNIVKSDYIKVVDVVNRLLFWI